MNASFSSATYSPDQLLAGGEEPVSRQVTILSGQNLTRGAVLGRITASGKYTLSASGATDGSQTPDCILVSDTDASGGDKAAMAYFVGRFNAGRVTLGTGHTVATVTEGLRTKGIHLISAQGA